MADLRVHQKFEQLPDATAKVNVTNASNPNKVHIRFHIIRNIMDVMEMEAEVAEMVNNEDPEMYIPRKNELVLAYQGMFQRYVRMVVEEVGEAEELYFNVWAIDYGIGGVIYDPMQFRKLPEKFKNVRSPIAEMCLDVQPIKNINGVTTLASYTEWDEAAVELFKRALNGAVQLKIVEQKFFNGIIFGDILAKSADGKVISLKQSLIEHNYAVELDYSEAFMKELFESPLGRRQYSFRYELPSALVHGVAADDDIGEASNFAIGPEDWKDDDPTITFKSDDWDWDTDSSSDTLSEDQLVHHLESMELTESKASTSAKKAEEEEGMMTDSD